MAAEIKRNLKAVVADLAEGFVTLNPIYLKPFDEKSLKSLHELIERRQIELRAEPFPYHDTEMIRKRNMRLQKLYTGLIVIQNYAREKKFALKEQPKGTRKRTLYF